MLLPFFTALRDARVPVSITEWLHLMEANTDGPLWIGVWSGNEKAQRLYAAYRFAKVGEYQYPVGPGWTTSSSCSGVDNRPFSVGGLKDWMSDDCGFGGINVGDGHP